MVFKHTHQNRINFLLFNTKNEKYKIFAFYLENTSLYLFIFLVNHYTNIFLYYIYPNIYNGRR